MKHFVFNKEKLYNLYQLAILEGYNFHTSFSNSLISESLINKFLSEEKLIKLLIYDGEDLTLIESLCSSKEVKINLTPLNGFWHPNRFQTAKVLTKLFTHEDENNIINLFFEIFTCA